MQDIIKAAIEYDRLATEYHRLFTIAEEAITARDIAYNQVLDAKGKIRHAFKDISDADLPLSIALPGTDRILTVFIDDYENKAFVISKAP